MSWMSWKDLQPYKEQLIDLELELIMKYHYPEKKIPRNFVEDKVNNLENYLEKGNTFFWGVIQNDILVGYYWAYVSMFINIKRWEIRSVMFRDNFQHKGLGNIALEEGHKKALALGCDEEATAYAAWNVTAGNYYKNQGFKTTRIEIVKRLN